MEEKIFMWYDSGGRDHQDSCPILGPYMSYDNKIIGEKYYHSLEELMKINISDSIKKKLMTSKIGTKIKIMRLHSCGNLMLIRIDNKQIEYLNKLSDIINIEVELKTKIYKLKKEEEDLIDLLFPKN